MPVNKKARAFYFKIFDGTETAVANTIMKFQKRTQLRKYAPSERIPSDYAKTYRAYWKQFGIHVSPMWGWYYASRNGNTDVRYIPNILYYTKIDQYFNARKLGYGFNDKNYYSKIFNGIKQPVVLVRKINKLLFDEQYRQISHERATELMKSVEEVICKPSQESGSGRGIFFVKRDEVEIIENFLTNPEYDNFIVQSLINQHPAMSAIHSRSVNTLRICSLLSEDGVHVLSAILRMGVGDSRIDNATAKDNAIYDGMTCGIDEQGKLKKYAYGFNTGKRWERHPDGITFEGYQIPSYEKALELVRACHTRIGNFRMVSWDVAIDAEGDPVLIEVNMRKGDINFHQFNNGPLFGDLTEKVLKEVFGK